MCRLFVSQEFNWKKDEKIVRGSRCHVAENGAGMNVTFSRVLFCQLYCLLSDTQLL